MSFGWSAGDIFASAKFLWDVCRALDDANGAPEHHRRSAATLKLIQFRLRVLGRVVGEEENPNPRTETEEAGLLETNDKDDIRFTVVNLKIEISKLEALVKGGSGKETDGARKGHRDWAKQQVKKLAWYFGSEKEVYKLIQHVFQLTASLPDLYQLIDRGVQKQQAVTQGVYHETQLEWLKAIHKELVLFRKEIAEQQLVNMNDRMEQLLYVGPDIGIDPDAGIGLDTGSAMSHLNAIAHEHMSPSLKQRTRNLTADHHLKKLLTQWFKGEEQIEPVLWIYGDQANIVSAIVYHAALDRRRPVVAFASRHNANGQYLSSQQRLFKMVYSVLFQVLQVLEEDSSFAVVGVDKPFTELGLSIDSMSLALQYIEYVLGLLPECICIVDGWNFITIDAEEQVDVVLKDFLELFKRPSATAAEGDRGGLRLLLTTPGNCEMLQSFKNQLLSGFGLGGHVGSQGMRLCTILRGMEWD